MERANEKRTTVQQKNRLKRKLASMAAMVLVLMLGIMGTMAYLSTVSKTKVNTFTGSKGISLELKEPEWNPNDPGTPAPGDGQYEAENYTPGKVIAKDPTLTNTTTGDTSATEWVAIAVSYQIGNDATPVSYKPISYEAMKYLINEIGFYDSTAAVAANSNDPSIASDKYWIPIYMTTNATDGAIADTSITLTDNQKSNAQAFAIYLYSKTLGKDESTPALFKQIKMKDATALEDVSSGLSALTTYVGGTTGGFLTKEYAVNGNLPGFQIDVIGAAVKNEYDKKDSAGTLAESISELSDANKNQLIKDLVEVLEPKIDAEVRKVGGN